jgi:c-di-AMP phosphodiesterase-like protein
MLFELLAIGAFGVIYYNNFFELQQIVTVPMIYIGISVVVGLNAILLWVEVIIFSNIRHKTDLKAADLIGADIQEAYNFGMIGLVIVDENNMVLWVNELFKERSIDILDVNIIEWQPALQDLIGAPSSTIAKVEINTRNYDVKYLADAGLFIFKDVTEYETIYSYSRKQAVVVGTIMIDNYSDLSVNADDSNDVISKVRNAIFEYARDHQVLIRRYRNDSYFMICNYESLKKMIDDKFSILETIHKIGEKEDTPPTLSIGIAHDFPDVVKLNEMANSAIEIAMSRGGDQVVVSRYGQDLMFFGGKSEAQENRNKVKVRVMADSVISLIKNSSNVLIMGHTMADMDAIGACLGMKAICEYCGKPSSIIYDPKLTEKKTRGAITTTFSREDISKIMVSPSEALDRIKTNTLVIVVDVHRPSMTLAPKVLEKATKVMVIDHHRRSEEFIESPVFSHIDPSASSSCELVAEFVRYSSVNPRIVIPSSYATVMLSGIFMDSNYFKSKTCGIRTFEASMILKEFGADNSAADDFLKDEFEEYTLITKIISTLKTPYYGVVYCVADEDDIIEAATLAKVGNQCMQMRGVNACFVIGKTAVNEVRISCRSDGSINVQLIAEKLNGGGHFTQSAASFKGTTIDRVESRLLDVLNEYLNDARNKQER